MLFFFRSQSANRVVRGALVVAGQIVLGIKNGKLALRLHDKGQLLAFGRFQGRGLRTEHLVTIPNPGRGINGIRARLGPENLTEVKAAGGGI